MSGECPPWCESNHTRGQDHVSREVRDRGLILQMVHFSREPEPVISIVDEVPGGGMVVIAESAALRLPELVKKLCQPTAAPLGSEEEGNSETGAP